MGNCILLGHLHQVGLVQIHPLNLKVCFQLSEYLPCFVANIIESISFHFLFVLLSLTFFYLEVVYWPLSALYLVQPYFSSVPLRHAIDAAQLAELLLLLHLIKFFYLIQFCAIYPVIFQFDLELKKIN